AVFLPMLLLFTGLAVDSGRAYVVKAQLSKAVDGAALGAARMLNSGNPQQEAANIYRANFPSGWMGTTSSTSPSEAGFFTMTTDTTTGVNRVNVRATAIVPTTFMRLANFQELRVNALGEATRRMVDLSLVMDVSSSIGWRWQYVRDAARTFVDAFDARSDRVGLVFFGNGARVVDAMPAGRGFDKARVIADIPNTLPGGSTAMVQGVYRGWDELRSVPNGQQSGLRVIVLFTDGASNSVPGQWATAPAGTSRGLRTWDFPDGTCADPDNQTHSNPFIDGLYNTDTGAASPSASLQLPWNSTSTISTIPFMPAASYHTEHRSGGIPTTFPFQVSSLTVNGVAQSSARGLRQFNAAQNRYPAQIYNVNNAARNLVEIIANAARADAGGDYPIRIYTIGMGELVRCPLGTRQEMSEEILKRVANDPTSPDKNTNQLEGRYYFAETAEHVSAAFQALQNQIIRLTK
ncbi:MAG: VWA domain-containing protein, partial [Vicinamibacterales bacterium]